MDFNKPIPVRGLLKFTLVGGLSKQSRYKFIEIHSGRRFIETQRTGSRRLVEQDVVYQLKKSAPSAPNPVPGQVYGNGGLWKFQIGVNRRGGRPFQIPGFQIPDRIPYRVPNTCSKFFGAFGAESRTGTGIWKSGSRGNRRGGER